MRAAWPSVRLGKVLTPVVREHQVDPSYEYPLLGVRLDGQGPFHRETVFGTQTSASRLYEVKTGDFIYSRLFAWRGAFGIIESALDSHFVSSEFPTFTAKRNRIDPKYLRFWFRLPDVLRRVEADCSGSTPLTRNRYKEQFFFALEIPLPPLDEQRRIVTRIEELSEKLKEARVLRQRTWDETDALIPSVLARLRETNPADLRTIASCSRMSTGTTPPSHRDDYYGGEIKWYTPGDLEYRRQLGSSSRTLSGRAVEDGKVRLFDPGTILLVAIGGSIGKVALANETCSANQQITGIKFSDDILPEYGFWWMRGLARELMAAAPQATLPIINQKRLGAFAIRILPLPEQRRIVAELDALQFKLDSVKVLQTETAAELDAMLPAILDKAFKGEL